MKYKMLFCDFDGTLANSQTDISEGNLRAIREYTNRGGTFVVSTGRMRVAILQFLQQHGFKGKLICFNGAEVLDIETEELLWQKSIPNKVAVEVLKTTESLGVYAQAYYDNLLIIDRRTAHTEGYELFSHITATLVNEKLWKHFERTGRNSTKILIFDEPDVLDRAFPVLYEKFSDRLSVVRSNPYHIEINDGNVTKGTAITYLANSTGVGIENVIAMGDGGNDVSMIEDAGLGIAVANAVEDLKKSADLVLDVTNDQDAVAYVINTYCK